jgi:Right handed beta helix region
VGILLCVLPSARPASSAEVGPGADWCAAVGALAPGEELVLRPGDYPGGCTIRRDGAPGAPLVIRAKDPDAPTRIVYTQRESNVLNLHASHVTIRGLRFGPTLADIDAIRIYAGHDITIEDCRFADLGGIAVVSNHTSIHSLVVRSNRIVRSNATAMYFGCHDGTWCTATGLEIERNYIDGVEAPSDQIGYGIEVKLNSTAAIRDNVIVDTKGPGIMVYGARDPAQLSIVERNLVIGSRTSSAIVVGGGPAIVRNNIATRSAESGIALENYGGRGLLRGVVLAHNTVYGNHEAGIGVPPAGRLEVTIANNAVHALPGTPALPSPTRPGVLSVGNVACASRRCFADPGARDFSPLALGPAAALQGAWLPRDDYFGRRRSTPSTPGAIERPAGPIPLAIKPRPP